MASRRRSVVVAGLLLAVASMVGRAAAQESPLSLPGVVTYSLNGRPPNDPTNAAVAGGAVEPDPGPTTDGGLADTGPPDLRLVAIALSCVVTGFVIDRQASRAAASRRHRPSP